MWKEERHEKPCFRVLVVARLFKSHLEIFYYCKRFATDKLVLRPIWDHSFSFKELNITRELQKKAPPDVKTQPSLLSILLKILKRQQNWIKTFESLYWELYCSVCWMFLCQYTKVSQSFWNLNNYFKYQVNFLFN